MYRLYNSLKPVQPHQRSRFAAKTCSFWQGTLTRVTYPALYSQHWQVEKRCASPSQSPPQSAVALGSLATAGPLCTHEVSYTTKEGWKGGRGERAASSQKVRHPARDNLLPRSFHILFHRHLPSYAQEVWLLESFCKFIFSRIKKGEGQGKEKCHAKSMMSKEAKNEQGSQWKAKKRHSACAVLCSFFLKMSKTVRG